MGIARKLLIRRAAERRSVASYAQFFEGTLGGNSVEFSLPADLTTLSPEDLEALSEQAVEHFNSLYGDGSNIATESLDVLSALTEAIEALATEKTAREAAAAEQREAAAALADRVKTTMGVATDVNVDPDGDGDDDETDQPDQNPDAEEDDATHGSAGQMEGEEGGGEGQFASQPEKRPVQIRIPARSSRQAKQAAEVQREIKKQGVENVVFASGDGLGVQRGTGMDFATMGRALDTRLKGFNLTSYSQAAAAGRELREVGSFAAIQRRLAPELTITSNDRTHIAEVIGKATALQNLREKKSLLASGGWNAASEVLYTEFLQLESATAGILSIPEIGIARGGAQITPGVSFADIYASVGFTYTEAEDISGDYVAGTPNTAGPKPVYHLEVPNFTDHRLGVSGLIIEAGLLAARGYPEYLADVIRKALAAHAHKVNGEVISDIVAGSTAVTMPTGTAPSSQAGATAPLLSAIELQAQHYRATFRMDPNARLEAVFPLWVTGVIRSDLSRRLGVDLISVPDSRILGWFTDRNISPQFVYDWQPIETTAAGSFTSWPTTVSFLLYSAGQWVKGVSDVITMDTLYDSALLANNDYTALFTEEGWFAAKVGTDSRVVTTAINPDGMTNAGGVIAADGTSATP